MLVLYHLNLKDAGVSALCGALAGFGCLRSMQRLINDQD